MHKEKPSFFARIPIAFGAFFRSLGNADFASRIETAREEPSTATAEAPAQPAAPALREISPDAALQLLALLQRDARLLDFVQENLAGYTDADIGAAARVVHEGCVKVLNEHFTIEAVRPEAEGSRVTLEQGFDAGAIRLTGNVVGEAPFTGALTHRGWRVTQTRLPKLAPGHDASILAPAEVEL